MAKDQVTILNEAVDDIEELQEQVGFIFDEIDVLMKRVRRIEKHLGIEKKKKPPQNGKG